MTGYSDLDQVAVDTLIRNEWTRAALLCKSGNMPKVIPNNFHTFYLGVWATDANGPRSVLLDIWEKQALQ